MESFFGSFKREALYRYRFKTEKDFFEGVAIWYSPSFFLATIPSKFSFLASSKKATPFFSIQRFVLNCGCQTGIKTKSSVRVLFFKKQVKMQLLNSNIPRSAQTTRYSSKKAQDLLNLVLFMFCSFFVLQRWLPLLDLNQ